MGLPEFSKVDRTRPQGVRKSRPALRSPGLNRRRDLMNSFARNLTRFAVATILVAALARTLQCEGVALALTVAGIVTLVLCGVMALFVRMSFEWDAHETPQGTSLEPLARPEEHSQFSLRQVFVWMLYAAFAWA